MTYPKPGIDANAELGGAMVPARNVTGTGAVPGVWTASMWISARCSARVAATMTVPAAVSSIASVPGGPVPNAFQVADLTFVSNRDGWALGTGECFKIPGERCTALLRTDDGGQQWQEHHF